MLAKVEQALPALAPRLQEVLVLLIEGKSEKQIATALQLSHHTVHTYIKVIHKKLEVTTRAELLAKVYQMIIADMERRAADQGRVD